MSKNVEKVMIKKEVLELLTDIFTRLEQEERDVKMEYVEVGKSDVQKTHWKTGELLWEDEEKTIPRYESIYDYREKETLSDKDKAKVDAVNQIRTALEKLI